MTIDLIFSNDWELFGDGSGDYFRDQHAPLQQLLDIFQGEGAKLTVMAEVAQQWALTELGNREPWARFQSESWEAILKETVRRGMDVQLHLHPQWLGGKWRNGSWDLPLDFWSISSLSHRELALILNRGKTYLDTLLKPVHPEYECIAFRAGASCIEPSEGLAPLFLDAGLLCDTSIVQGARHGSFYDFRKAHSNLLPWFVDDTGFASENPNPAGLLEIPIHSCSIWCSPLLRRISPRLHYLLALGTRVRRAGIQWTRKNGRWLEGRYPRAKRPHSTDGSKGGGMRVRRILARLLRRDLFILDTDLLPPRAFVAMLQKIQKNQTARAFAEHHQGAVPVMAIGHCKSMMDGENIKKTLREIRAAMAGNVRFRRLRDVIRDCIPEEKKATHDPRQP